MLTVLVLLSLVVDDYNQFVIAQEMILNARFVHQQDVIIIRNTIVYINLPHVLFDEVAFALPQTRI